MTLRDLYAIPWNCMTDRPNVNYPSRARTLACSSFANDHGVRMQASVFTNRTHRRFWLEISMCDGHWLHLYLTTASQKKAAEWIGAVKGGWSA